jgi:hypothetical protein
MTDPVPSLSPIGEFLFSAPLYTEYLVAKDSAATRSIFKFPNDTTVETLVDGYCPRCKKDTTFSFRKITLDTNDLAKFAIRSAFEELTLHCARSAQHSVRYFLLARNSRLQKVGQFPSLADIAIDETRQKYRLVLKGENWSEFYKAIGLAAHGEGIGSFVYLRRVFERLIYSRFEEFKSAEGWMDSDFYKLRMDEKVGFLKDHLPPYLIEIKRIYSIFSQGIHELENKSCLQFFEVGKRSIIIVLEEDLKKQEELLARKEMAAAVAQFLPTETAPEANDS